MGLEWVRALGLTIITLPLLGVTKKGQVGKVVPEMKVTCRAPFLLPSLKDEELCIRHTGEEGVYKPKYNRESGLG